MRVSHSPTGTLVLNVQARASAGQSIVYGLELPSGAEGVFQVDPQFGNITVGPDGPSMLVIRNHIQTTFVFQAFAYYNLSGLSGDRVRFISLYLQQQLIVKKGY